MNCDRGLLSDYCDGELTPELRRQVEAHVATCLRCQAVLQQYRDLGAALRDYGRVAVPATLPAQFRARIRREPETLGSRLARRLAGAARLRPAALGAAGTLAAAVVIALALSLAPIAPEERLTVVAAYPPNGASDVVLDEPIEVVFSQPVEADAVKSVRIEPSVPVESTVDGNKLIVRPTKPLQPDTQYKVVIEAKKPAPAAPQVPLPAAAAPTATPVTLSFSTGRTVASAPTATARPVVALLATQAPAASPTPASAGAPPTATPLPPAATALPSPSPRPTQPIAVAAASVAPTAQIPCVADVGLAAGALRQHPGAARKLICPLELERSAAVVEQGYEGGRVLWVQDSREVWVLLANGQWHRYPDTSRPAPTPSASPATAAHLTPAVPDAITRLLTGHQDVRVGLGKATGPSASHLVYIQRFAGGLTLSRDADSLDALYDDGTWQSVLSVTTPLPTATATATATPTNTPLELTPTATATATPTHPTPSPVVLPSPTAMPSPTATPPLPPDPTALPSSTPSAMPTASPTSEPSVTPTSTPTAPADGPPPTPPPVGTVASPPPTPTDTPSPTATPTPTSQPGALPTASPIHGAPEPTASSTPGSLAPAAG